MRSVYYLTSVSATRHEETFDVERKVLGHVEVNSCCLQEVR